jgi:hypothetical protein
VTAFAFLALRLREVRNDLRFARGRGLRRAALLVGLAALWVGNVALAVGVFLGESFGGLERAAAANPRRIESVHALELFMLAIVFNAQIFLGLLLDSAPAASLLSRDVLRVLVAPVPLRRIVLAKLVESFPAALGVVAPFVAASTLSYALARNATTAGLVAGTVLSAALTILTLSLSVLLAVSLARLFPRGRVKIILETGAGLTVAIGYIAIGWFHIADTIVETMTSIAQDPSPALHGIARTLSVLPGGWAARGVTALADGRLGEAVFWLGVLLLLAMMSLAIASRVAARLYADGWSPLETDGRDRARRASRPFARPVASALRAQVVKDVRLFLRSPEILVPALFVLLYFAFPLYASRKLGGDARALVGSGGWAACLLFGYELAARAIPLDRLSFWRLRAAPVSGRSIARCKHLSACLLGLGCAAAGQITVATLVHLDAAAIVIACTSGIALFWLGAALGVWFGAHFANFAWSNRETMLRLPGRWVAVPVFLLPFVLVLTHVSGWVAPHSLRAALIMSGVIALICGAAAEICLLRAARRIERIEWLVE